MAEPGGQGTAAGVWRFAPAAVAAIGFVLLLPLVGPVGSGAAPEVILPWAPSLGVELTMRLDGLALGFALLVTGIGAVCLGYAASYFRTDPRLGSLLVTMSLFAVSMLGLVVADDVVTLFVFWEATTVTSWLLVGFDHARPAARAAALQALMVTGLGGLALLAGLLIAGEAAGTLRLSGIAAAGEALRAASVYPWAFGLVALAAFTKSAQFPFQFWLPAAMAAPTPVSAYLHSATMVKAGVYLLARMAPGLGGTEAWLWTLAPAGAATMLVGSLWALRQEDLKLMLAHTTLMGLGLITLLIGLGSEAAVAAAMAFLLVHALYKAALFLAVGAIERGAGGRDWRSLGGLAGALPATFAVAALAGLSMAGIPPFLGFVAKEMVYGAALDGPAAWAVAAAAVLASAAMVSCAGLVAARPFLGADQRSPATAPHDPGAGLWAGAGALAALGLVFGLAPALAERIVASMARSAGAAHVHLELWHGFGWPLALSGITLATGLALYAGAARVRAALAAAEPRTPRTETGYDAALAGTFALARIVTGAVQDGMMTRYMRRTFAVLAALIWAALILGEGGAWPRLSSPPDLVGWVVVALIVGSTAMVLKARERMTAIAGLGGIGTGIAIVFVLYGAIDVAMTQLFVEILVVVFLAIAMLRLPARGPEGWRPADALLAAALGLGVTVATLAALGASPDPFMTRFFEEASYTQAHGRNVVNVILVDFRGLDTMGEISVIVIAGVAALAALRAGRGARP